MTGTVTPPLDLAQHFLDRVEVGKVAGAVVDLGVLDDALAIDDEGGAFGDTAHGEVLLGEEGVVSAAVGFGDIVFVVGEEGNLDAFLFGPIGLGEGVVAADPVDFGAEALVVAEAFADGAEFGGADTGEGHGEEEEDGLGAGRDFRKLDEGRAVAGEGGEGEIWGLVADVNGHVCICGWC